MFQYFWSYFILLDVQYYYVFPSLKSITYFLAIFRRNELIFQNVITYNSGLLFFKLNRGQ